MDKEIQGSFVPLGHAAPQTDQFGLKILLQDRSDAPQRN